MYMFNIFDGNWGGYIPMIVEKQIVAMRGRNPDNPKCREKGIYLEQTLELNKGNIANCITTVEKDNLVMETEQIRIKQATKEGSIPYGIGGVFDGGFPSSKTRRGRVIDNGNVCPTITAQNQELYRIEICESDMPGALILYMPATDTYYQVRIRKLTPRECLKLMNVDEKYLNRMLDVECNTNLYKAAGNSIVVNCLTAILGQLYEGKEEIYKQI